MISILRRTVREWFTLPEQELKPVEDRSGYQRLPLPHSFKPQLSVWEAVMAVTEMLLRIILGSLLFAVSGTYAWIGLSSISNVPLRIAATLPVLIIFGLLLTFLMLAISRLFKSLAPKTR